MKEESFLKRKEPKKRYTNVIGLPLTDEEILIRDLDRFMELNRWSRGRFD